jgi:hypothetical protein
MLALQRPIGIVLSGTTSKLVNFEPTYSNFLGWQQVGPILKSLHDKGAKLFMLVYAAA